MTTPDEIRANFAALIDASNGDEGCWHWRGSRAHGVPLFTFERGFPAQDARWVSWMLWRKAHWIDISVDDHEPTIGPGVRTGFVNTCGTDGCVNPDHVTFDPDVEFRLEVSMKGSH